MLHYPIEDNGGKMGLTLEEEHNLEHELERTLRRESPTLLRFYRSTHEAIDAYSEALFGHKFFEEAK